VSKWFEKSGVLPDLFQVSGARSCLALPSQKSHDF
jgi:hypothetical protein